MSYTNSTTHYALPLPTGSDKSLFTDTNQAFQDIDAAIYSAETVANQAGTDITAIKATIINLQNADVTFQNDITSLKGRMTAVEGVASQNTTDIADVRHDAEDMITAHNEATATSAAHYNIGDEFIYNDVLYRATSEINIGDTIVPNTNCSATNVMTEVNTINTALSGKANTASVIAITDDLYSTGTPLISTDISSAQDLTPSEPFTNFNTIKVRIGAYYSAQDRNLYMQAFDIDLRHLVGSADEFIYSWYQSATNFMTVEFGIVSGKLQINAIQLGTDAAQSFAIYVEAYGYHQTL